MDFVLDRSAGGLGPLRWGMGGDEAVAALDGWRQRPGPPALAVRDSGLCVSPAFGGVPLADGDGPVCGVTLSRTFSAGDRVLFDGLDLFGGPLGDVVAGLRGRGYRVDDHGNGVFTVNDLDVWLRLERRPGSASPVADNAGLVVARASRA